MEEKLSGMYGWPPRGKGFLALLTIGRSAGMYTAFDCGAFMPLALM